MILTIRRLKSSTRRFSTTTNISNPRILQWFKQSPPIEELPEMKSLRAIERLTERIGTNHSASNLSKDDENGYRAWIRAYRSERSIDSINKEVFDEMIKAASTYLQSTENRVLQDQPKIPPADEEEEYISPELHAIRDAYTEVIALKLARFKCDYFLQCFTQLDTNADGNLDAEQVYSYLDTLVMGTSEDWVRFQFQLCDADRDDIINETQSKSILDTIVQTQRQVLSEVFLLHMDQLPKKHVKLYTAAMNETNWNQTIPERIRSVFHFAEKEELAEGLDKVTTPRTVHWEDWKESQEAEFPQLTEIMHVYAKGVYDERYTFYERKRDTRSTRFKGFLLAIALGFGDYVFAMI